MAELNIPTRPSQYDKVNIKRADADCLTYSVLMGGKNEDVFRLFHPEYIDGAGKLSSTGKKACKQFFLYAKNREYIDAYKAELTEFLSRGSRTATEIDESRKDKALKALLNQAMGLVEDGTNLDADSLKTISDIFTKLKLIKQEEEVQEKPRRYIPVSCSACAYKKFIEEHIASGDIEETEEAND